MSTETAVHDRSDRYANPDTAQEIAEKRAEEAQRQQADEARQATRVKTARETLAEEDQPGGDLPQPEAKTVMWRGAELEFAEMGEALADLVRVDEDPDASNSDMITLVVDVFARKCLHPDATREYWTQFDLMRSDETDGLLDLFEELTGSGDLTPEQREQIEEFRAE
jgi:hypothetical protein